MAKNIEKLYSDIFKLRDDLEDFAERAKDIASDSKDYPGIINKVLTEQITKYFIPDLLSLKDDTSKPGSLAGIVKFLDAVPLAYTRDKEEIASLDPIIPENSNINTPAGSSIENPGASDIVSEENNSIDNIPQNTSYNKPNGEVTNISNPPNNNVEVRESLDKKSFYVKRISKILDPLGEEKGKSNKGSTVYETLDEEEAKAKAAYLNSTVLPGEKDILGTEYIVCDSCEEN